MSTAPVTATESPVLRMEAVRKSFGTSLVLRDVDLEVAPHTVTALIGASGSGKSTLLRCANLLEEIDDGAIWLEGEEITDPRTDADAVRRRIGWCCRRTTSSRI
ncbi:ABC transporter OS=Streptomyces microflavus OX=1919 GN=Smic_82220 PE=4 SV=1 [Streptomyces microflavus]